MLNAQRLCVVVDSLISAGKLCDCVIFPSDSRARRKIDEENKTMGDERGKREPSLWPQSSLVFSRVRFNSLHHHLNSALYYLNAWYRLTDERMCVLNLVVGR